MPSIPILNGIYADGAPNWRTSYPRNMVPVPKNTGISQGYLRPADGLVQFGAGPGAGRGGIKWNGTMYRVMGTKLVSVSAAGVINELGDIAGSGPVTMDYSFDRLAIWGGNSLYYWDGSALEQVTDSDLGAVIDGVWIAGYFLSTDGTSLIVTELNDPLSVLPTKYGSAESDPDPVQAVDKLRNEAYALGRHTIEVFENIGGSGFPFQRVESAQVSRGIIGTRTYCTLLETFAFIGGGRNEAPAVWIMGAGTTDKISTAEIDRILATYTEEQLAAAIVESQLYNGHERLLMHLPDVCWAYDVAATKAVGEPVWYSLDSGLGDPSTYRARNLVRCYDKWIGEDPTSSALVELVETRSDHLGSKIAWAFGTMVLYVDGSGAILPDIELITLPGRVALGVDPTIWTAYSLDGETWSRERPRAAGKQGQRAKRLAWRDNGSMELYRMQRFRGTSDAHIAVTALSIQFEALNSGAYSG